jgi:hypothetical protein
LFGFRSHDQSVDLLINIISQIRPHEQTQFRPHDHNFDLMKNGNFYLMKFDLMIIARLYNPLIPSAVEDKNVWPGKN